MCKIVAEIKALLTEKSVSNNYEGAKCRCINSSSIRQTRAVKLNS